MQAATSIRRYCRFFRHKGATKVLDYGAGKLRNALFLADEGFTVIAADLPQQVRKIRDCPAIRHLAGVMATDRLPDSELNVDLVLSTYVFNIIMENNEQERYLNNIRQNLRPGGYLLIEVRCRKQSGACGEGCSEFFKCPDCAKTYSHEELDQLLVPYGFRRVSHYYCHQAVAAIYQLNPNQAEVAG